MLNFFAISINRGKYNISKMMGIGMLPHQSVIQYFNFFSFVLCLLVFQTYPRSAGFLDVESNYISSSSANEKSK